MIFDRIQNMIDGEIEDNYDKILRDTYVEWFDDQKFTPPEDSILEDTQKEDMSLYFLIKLNEKQVDWSSEYDVFNNIVYLITNYEILKENDDLQSQYYHQITLDMHEFLRELEGQYDTDKMITHNSSYIEPAHAFLSFLLSQKNDENDIYGWEFAKEFNANYIVEFDDLSQPTQPMNEEIESAMAVDDGNNTFIQETDKKFSAFQKVKQQTYETIMDLKFTIMDLKLGSALGVGSSTPVTPEKPKSRENPVTPGTALQRKGTVRTEMFKLDHGPPVGELGGASSSPTEFKPIKRPISADASISPVPGKKMAVTPTGTEGGKKKKKKRKRKTKKKRKKMKRTKRRIRKKKTKKRRKRRKRTRRKGRKRR